MSSHAPRRNHTSNPTVARFTVTRRSWKPREPLIVYREALERLRRRRAVEE